MKKARIELGINTITIFTLTDEKEGFLCNSILQTNAKYVMNMLFEKIDELQTLGYTLEFYNHHFKLPKKNLNKEKKCIKCGCTDDNPCYNPRYGYCWWANLENTICSHCATTEIRKDKHTKHKIYTTKDYEFIREKK